MRIIFKRVAMDTITTFLSDKPVTVATSSLGITGLSKILLASLPFLQWAVAVLSIIALLFTLYFNIVKMVNECADKDDDDDGGEDE